MNPYFKKYLFDLTHSNNCEELEIIQSLWSGYGKIFRIQLDNQETLVVKNIELSRDVNHPRGWNTNFGHQRKVRSYVVERNWYQNWSSMTNDSCKIPDLIGSYSEGKDQWIVLEDLNIGYPLRKHSVSLEEVKVCLNWLANFHGQFLNQDPKDLWPVGTYWHLATRPEEFERIEHQELKAKASQIDEILNQARFQTIVHGDAKLANFCFSEDGSQVAAVDFQYVGGGCGMKDVSYFLGSCFSSSELEKYEEELLNYYFVELKKALKDKNNSITFYDLEQEWRDLYSFACADFARFLLGWSPGHQKLNGYLMGKVNLVLSSKF